MDLLVPSTFGMNERDPRLAAMRYGAIARAAAIFRIDHVHIYMDRDQGDEEENAERFEKYLSYAECPPYLRKQLIPHDPDLKHAAILPPLKMLSHGYSETFREAAVKESGGGESMLEAGLEDDVSIPQELPEDARITIKQVDGAWRRIDPDAINGFWTFGITNHRETLGTVMDKLPGPAIGTSAHGEDIGSFRSSPYTDRDDAAIVFGSAWRGLYDMMERGEVAEDQFAGIYNTVPEQGVETVRTDEAVFITLGIVNTV